MPPMETSKVNHLPAAETSGSILERPSLNCRGNLALEDLPQGVWRGWNGESLIALNQGWDAYSLCVSMQRKSIGDLHLPPASPMLALTPPYPLLSLVLT